MPYLKVCCNLDKNFGLPVQTFLTFDTVPMGKKIVIIGPAYPYRGGQALVEAHLFSLLTQLGYDCLTLSYSLLYPAIFFPGSTQYDRSDKVYYEHSNKILRLINSINPFSWLRTAAKLLKIKPDVVVIVWWMPFFGPALSTIAYLAKKFGGIKVVFLIENYLSHEQRWFNKLFAHMALNLGDAFIAQSKFMAKRIAEDYPAKEIFVTTLPVFDCFNNKLFSKESARKHLGITTKNVVLFFGYIRPYKGLEGLLRAFGEVVVTHPDTTLLIVGESYEKWEKYQAIIEEVGIEQHCKIVLQYVANEEVEPYYKAADLTCLPYDSASQSGIVMVSYAFGRPVVVTDVGGLPEFVRPEKTGMVVQPGNVRELAMGINQVLNLNTTEDFEQNIADLNRELGYSNLKKVFQNITNSSHT